MTSPPRTSTSISVRWAPCSRTGSEEADNREDEMAADYDAARAELVQTMLQKIKQDAYPSTTMLNLLEDLLTDEEMPEYVLFLQDRIRDDQYPSIPLLNRLVAIAAPA